MISASGIPYLTHVWNCVVGCWGPGGTAESPRRCPGCWAERFYATRGQGLKCELCKSFTPHVHPERLTVPGGKPKVIGVGFMTDLFGNAKFNSGPQWTHPDHTVCRDTIIRTLVHEIQKHPEHVFVTVTKAPENLPDLTDSTGLTASGYPDNWWIGATCRTQAEVDAKVPALLRSGVKHPFLNLEPLCGPVDIGRTRIMDGIGYGLANPLIGIHPLVTRTGEWGRGMECVILGGMSKQGREHQPVPLHPDWVRSVRDQCADAGVPFYFKQWGAQLIGSVRVKVPKIAGRTHRELPGRWGELMGGKP